MSEPNTEMTVDHPFVETTTPKIERANRLIGLRSHPGFRDLVQITLDLAEEADKQLVSFRGWDAQAITAHALAAQISRRFQQELVRRMAEQIGEGIMEAKELASKLPEKNAQQMLDDHDYVRRMALDKFSEFDDRVAGSY
jgi:hypothetical protein